MIKRLLNIITLRTKNIVGKYESKRDKKNTQDTFINQFSCKIDVSNRLLRHIDWYCESLVNVKNRFLRFQFSHACVTRTFKSIPLERENRSFVITTRYCLVTYFFYPFLFSYNKWQIKCNVNLYYYSKKIFTERNVMFFYCFLLILYRKMFTL